METLKNFFINLPKTWWGITIIVVFCALVWLALSILLYRQFFKRFYDIVLSGLAIIVLSPVLLILTIVGAIKMQGNPFFTQKRPGKKEKIFKLIKFRTMTNKKDENGNLLPDAARLTKYGKFLRSTSLDELPELFNIFIGQMSIIGPRPLLIQHLPYYNDQEKHRHDVRPGLTGLAQVNGRNNLSWEGKFKKDIEYLENINLIKDIKIIILTAFKVFSHADVTVGTEIDFSDYRINNLKAVNKEKEIGSEFWNYQVSKTQMKINCVGDRRDFISGRSALAYIINDIKVNRKINSVYMPAYCCESVVNVFNYNNIKVFFYDIEFKDDKVEYILDDNIDCDLILVMNYFGFNHSDYIKFFDLYHDKIIIEDITHSLFGIKQNDLVSYSFASIRKWDAIPCGGIAIKKNGKFHINQYFLNNKFIQKRKEAMNIKKLYIENKIENKQQYLQLFREAENLLENDYNIDTIANEYYYIDEASLISKRQQNAKYLITNMQDIINIEIPFFVQKGDCPLFVPILIKNNQRNDLQKYLINEDIYLPIHWPLICDISNEYKCIEYFSNELSIVCDQRYGLDDMQIIVNKIRGFMNK